MTKLDNMAVQYTKVFLLCVLNVSTVQVKKKFSAFSVSPPLSTSGFTLSTFSVAGRLQGISP